MQNIRKQINIKNRKTNNETASENLKETERDKIKCYLLKYN